MFDRTASEQQEVPSNLFDMGNASTACSEYCCTSGNQRQGDNINLLCGFGMAIEYNGLLRVESEIEKAVIERMQNDSSMYLPPDVAKGRHIFFAIDNIIDFSKDTSDGKQTLHSTGMAIYQKIEAQDV